MKKATKIWLTVAAAFVVLGCVLVGCAFAAGGFRFDAFATERYETHTYTVKEPFSNLSVELTTAEIEFCPTDEMCRVVCKETSSVRYSVAVENDTLRITESNTRSWYAYAGIWFELPKITVFLPEKEFRSLQLNTKTGDIAIPADFTFESIQIDGTTASVRCAATTLSEIAVRLTTGNCSLENSGAKQINLTTTTGNLTIQSLSCENRIFVKTSTGNINLTSVRGEALSAESSTGIIALEKVLIDGEMDIRNRTGDVRLQQSDAAEIAIETTTGSVRGSLCSEKLFSAQSKTGAVSVPRSTAGGKCEIITKTGDIKITLQ